MLSDKSVYPDILKYVLRLLKNEGQTEPSLGNPLAGKKGIIHTDINSDARKQRKSIKNACGQ